MEDIYETIIKLKKKGESAALATVTMRDGSAPREQGAKMLVLGNGAIVGSVGGGKLEAEVREKAQKVIATGKATTVHFDLTGKEAGEEGMICGGVTDVFIEPILSTPTLYIFGAGHISIPVSKIGKMLGFNVVIIDDRADFANKERFPEADKVIAQDLDKLFPKLDINKLAYIVIVTRGHLHDEHVLEWAVKTDAGYIGMIGSKQKVSTLFNHLRSRGVPAEKLATVNAPIGLEIYSDTPEEIAVSIMAEIIKVRNMPR